MRKRRDEGVKVELPKPEDDQPNLGRVGIIAAVGFAIGVVWPWLAGVRLVPSPPAAEAVAEPVPSGSVAPAASIAPMASAAPARAPEPERTEKQSVNVGEALIVGCRDDKGHKVDPCDKVDFDAVAKGRLLNLANCPEAAGMSKVLSVGFELDFTKNQIEKISEGKSTTFGKETSDALLKCAKAEFETAKLDGITHEQAHYSVYYPVEFVPPGTLVEKASPSGGGEEETTEASGLATVSWDSALVRDQPDGGEIRARLRYGTKVIVTGKRGKWYLIKYDAKGNQGWVHKNAIGL